MQNINETSATARPSRKRLSRVSMPSLSVLVGGNPTLLTALGECGVCISDKWNTAFKSVICRDQNGKFYMVNITQHMFTNRSIRVTARRLSDRIGARYAANPSPVGALPKGGR